MKRNLDLARQLLLDIENRGADCSTSALRGDSNHQREEQIRYHLRLLIDGKFLKEVDRTSEGIPCVRLTQDGHELLELARNDSRWSEAKRVCWERTGGLSLDIISGLLARWAMIGSRRTRRRRRTFAPGRYRLDAPLAAPIEEPPYNGWHGRPVESGRYAEEDYSDPDVRYVRVHSTYLEDRDRRDHFEVDLDGGGMTDAEVDATWSDTIL